MKNLISLKNHARTALSGVTNSIQKAGHHAPANDTGDVRSQQAWETLSEFCEEHNAVSVTHCESFDYSLMAPTDDTYIAYYQPRDNADLPNRIKANEEKLFGANPEPLLKLPWVFKDKRGKYLTPIGNGRAYTFKKRKWIGPAILIDVSEAPEREYLELAMELSHISNVKNEHSTDEEGEKDWRKKLKTQLSHLEEFYPKRYEELMKDEDTMMEWANDFFIKKIRELKGDDRQSIRTKLAKQAFDIDYGNSLPMPENEGIQEQFRQYKPHHIWNPENTSNVIQIDYSSNFSGLKSVINSSWETHDIPGPIRKRTELAIRIGGNKTDKKNVSAVVKGRESFRTSATTTNKHPQWVFAGKPIIACILFVEQFEGGLLPAELWEWDFNQEIFLECPKIV